MFPTGLMMSLLHYCLSDHFDPLRGHDCSPQAETGTLTLAVITTKSQSCMGNLLNF